MGPHGGSFAGSSHSHSEQYPDDNWNLFCMLDSCTGYNITRNEDAMGVFKPHARRLEVDPQVVSAVLTHPLNHSLTYFYSLTHLGG